MVPGKSVSGSIHDRLNKRLNDFLCLFDGNIVMLGRVFHEPLFDFREQFIRAFLLCDPTANRIGFSLRLAAKLHQPFHDGFLHTDVTGFLGKKIIQFRQAVIVCIAVRHIITIGRAGGT